uniref:Putative LAGLIDADG homing endonuclease n=1 Tax=Hafniomonas laevis TaxID=436124 RepID=A0A0S2LNV5_9CHLO|nr:putative LAGLIDADG homing endonuclease [Hafniomonas laevis]YP_009185017.1 putative LAGLIDADG homing endonuclease [Hafniomonas laevis]ALO63089.1 putative LAGLIDADG homing endonuclease [Hafniomonas laevis]ALO63094.1 putative LAGLIDADG homing endonuclease [Hafniomonas laevis]
MTKKIFKWYEVPDYLKGILVGWLLGDASLDRDARTDPINKKLAPPTTCRLRILQSEKQHEYVMEKYKLLKEITPTPPKLYDPTNPDSRTGKKYVKSYFNTTQEPCFLYYFKAFYVETTTESGDIKYVKRVPPNIGELLTPEGIAHWFMDDGSAKWHGHSNAIRFSTDCFSKEDIQLLQDVLREKYQLETSAVAKRKGWNIETTSAGYDIIKKLIYPHLYPSMMYKFPGAADIRLEEETDEIDDDK